MATRLGETGTGSRRAAGCGAPEGPSARSTASRTSFRTSFSLGVRMGRGSLADRLASPRATTAAGGHEGAPRVTGPGHRAPGACATLVGLAVRWWPLLECTCREFLHW